VIHQSVYGRISENAMLAIEEASIVEDYATEKGIAEIHTRFAYWYREAAAFYPAKGFFEVERNEHLILMMKRLK